MTVYDRDMTFMTFYDRNVRFVGLLLNRQDAKSAKIKRQHDTFNAVLDRWR